MAKKFAFKGLDLEQLQKLSFDDFVKLVGTKERRTLKRMSLSIRKFIEKVRKAKKTGKILETHVRHMIIIPEMIGTRVKVYNGKTFQDIAILPDMIGHRLGEYSITIKQVRHSGPGVGATRGSKAVELK